MIARDAIRTVFFDLDGTLADTAPDLAGALNRLLSEAGAGPLAGLMIRNHVSRGSAALVRLAFGETLNETEFERLRQRLLTLYAERLCEQTGLFAGMTEVLDTLEREGLSWGVVTNKPGWLTQPLMARLGLDGRAACIISGDTLTERKPHPKPLLHACELAGCVPGGCVFVGDDPRDIQAGRAAGLATLVACYGYIAPDEDPSSWQPDGLLTQPQDLLNWLGIEPVKYPNW